MINISISVNFWQLKENETHMNLGVDIYSSENRIDPAWNQIRLLINKLPYGVKLIKINKFKKKTSSGI